MNAVGIDVSKGKSMVAIMRPFGEIVSTPIQNRGFLRPKIQGIKRKRQSDRESGS